MNIKLEVSALQFDVASLEEASSKYCELRDASGEGASTWPTGTVTKKDGTQLYISYNGKIWEGDPNKWRPGLEPVYSPYDLRRRP